MPGCYGAVNFDLWLSTLLVWPKTKWWLSRNIKQKQAKHISLHETTSQLHMPPVKLYKTTIDVSLIFSLKTSQEHMNGVAIVTNIGACGVGHLVKGGEGHLSVNCLHHTWWPSSQLAALWLSYCLVFPLWASCSSTKDIGLQSWP